MKISLVTPCFNAARYIEETITSVLAQDVPELEYIIVDGGSTDGTADIIRRHEARLACWISEQDSGQVDALNKGFARATGEIVGFLNADDVLKPGALRTVLEAFTRQPEADLVYGRVEWIHGDGSQAGLHAGDISNLDEILDIYGVWWAERQWIQPEVFYRRSLKERVGTFDERYNLAFDYDFWVRCFRAGARVARLPECLVQFRLHAHQKSKDLDGASEEIRAILQDHIRDGAPVPRRVEARLRYHHYQLGQGAKPGFLRALAANPDWLLVADVRQRLLHACIRRLWHR